MASAWRVDPKPHQRLALAQWHAQPAASRWQGFFTAAGSASSPRRIGRHLNGNVNMIWASMEGSGVRGGSALSWQGCVDKLWQILMPCRLCRSVDSFLWEEIEALKP